MTDTNQEGVLEDGGTAWVRCVVRGVEPVELPQLAARFAWTLEDLKCLEKARDFFLRSNPGLAP